MRRSIGPEGAGEKCRRRIEPIAAGYLGGGLLEVEKGVKMLILLGIKNVGV